VLTRALLVCSKVEIYSDAFVCVSSPQPPQLRWPRLDPHCDTVRGWVGIGQEEGQCGTDQVRALTPKTKGRSSPVMLLPEVGASVS
jgi:hypothetical protein